MSQDTRERLAKNLKEYRTKANLKKEHLSLALNFDSSYISKVENEKVNISLNRLELIANFLEIDIVDLLKK